MVWVWCRCLLAMDASWLRLGLPLIERASFGLAFLAKAKGRRLRSTPFPVVSDNETVPPTMDR